MSYSVRGAALPADEPVICGLWREGFPWGDEPQHKLHGYHQGNPFAGAEIYLLAHSDETDSDNPVEDIAGVKCLARYEWYDFSAGKALSAANFADFVVSQRHRSLGPAISLLKNSVSLGLERSDWLYGLPNKKAQPVFKRVGYQPVTQFVRYARLLKVSEKIRQRWPKIPGFVAALADGVLGLIDTCMAMLRSTQLKGSWLTLPAADNKDIAELFKHSAMVELCAVRDSERLSWRFSQTDGRQFYELRDGQGSLQAYAICQPGDVAGDISLDDVFAVDQKVLADLLQKLVVAVRKQYPGANTISFSACLPTHVEAVFKQAGYLAREEEAVFGVANDEVQLQQFAERAFMTRFDKDA